MTKINFEDKALFLIKLSGPKDGESFIKLFGNAAGHSAALTITVIFNAATPLKNGARLRNIRDLL